MYAVSVAARYPPPKFNAKLLGKYDVGYFLCGGCGSLQTEPPHWLGEAYASNLGDRDCGAAQRNLSNFAVCLALAKIWGVRNAIDHGGGDGLLTRMLRDYRINCYVEDKYASPTYALAFTEPDFERPDAIFAFEVFEHFTDPVAEIAALFAHQPDILFGTTERYTGQGADWWYLSRHSGHHIFFYSDEAMRQIAARHGYRLIQSGPFFCFVSPARYTAIKARATRFALTGISRRLVRMASAIVPPRGVGADIALLKNQ